MNEMENEAAAREKREREVVEAMARPGMDVEGLVEATGIGLTEIGEAGMREEEAVTRAMARMRPGNRAQLYGWLRAVLGVRVPWRGVCPGHGSPLDYLEHVFFERGGDSVVWANRGGGKTFYGAAATLLDL